MSGCGGGSASGTRPATPAAASSAAPKAANSGNISITLDTRSGLTTTSAAARRDASRLYRGTQSRERRILAVNIGSIIFTATLYPGDVGTQQVSASTTVTTSTIPSSVAINLTNAPIGNNEWIIVEAVAYDPTMTSHYVLGNLAGLVTVPSSGSASVTLDQASTDQLEVALGAMKNGLISTYDLDNNTGLSANLASLTAGVAPHPLTGMIGIPALATLMNTMYASYGRSLTISETGTAMPAVATVSFDDTQQSELTFITNVNASVPQLIAGLGPPSPTSGLVTFNVVGNPFATGSALIKRHIPITGPVQVQPISVVDSEYDAPSGSVLIQKAYGGHLIVGMSAHPLVNAAPPPFYGGVALIPGAAAGSASSAAVTVSNTTVQMTMNDPQGAAFGSADYYYAAPTASVTNFSSDCSTVSYSRCTSVAPNAIVQTPMTSANLSLSVDTFTPWNAGVQVCTFLDCFPVVANSTNTVRSPFADLGTNLAYYNWAAGAGATSVSADSSGRAYDIQYSNTTSATISSATSAYFYSGQHVLINNNGPDGTIWTLSAICGGNAIQQSGVNQSGQAIITMSSIGGVVSCSGVTITFSLPSSTASSGTMMIGPIRTQP